MKDLLHFDPIQVILLVSGMIAAYLKFFRRQTLTAETVNQLVSWQREHAKDCGDNRKATTQILTEVQKTNEKLTVLAEGHEKRIDRLERQHDAASGASA